MNNDFNAVQKMLMNTISMLCKNSLIVNRTLKIEGVIGITVDDSVFIVHINESESKSSEMDQLVLEKIPDSSPISNKRRRDNNRNSTPKIKVKPEPVDENWGVSPTNIDAKDILNDSSMLIEQNNFGWKPTSGSRKCRRPRSTAKRKSLAPTNDPANWSEGVWPSGHEIGDGMAEGTAWIQDRAGTEWDQEGSINQQNHDQGHSIDDTLRKSYGCQYPDCSAAFKRSDSRLRHERAVHGAPWPLRPGKVSFYCQHDGCTRYFYNQDFLVKHITNEHCTFEVGSAANEGPNVTHDNLSPIAIATVGEELLSLVT